MRKDFMNKAVFWAYSRSSRISAAYHCAVPDTVSKFQEQYNA